MAVLTSSDLEARKQGVSAPGKPGVDALDEEFDLVGFKFPNAPEGVSKATFTNESGEVKTVELVDKCYRFGNASGAEIDNMKREFLLAGFEEVLETRSGKPKPVEVKEEVIAFTLRHPEFEEVPGERPYKIGDDTYTMNSGVIKTQKPGVKKMLIKKGFELVNEEVSE